jgi:16S rRNA (guanine(966)-N(2))-methyltransferase RsmD
LRIISGDFKGRRLGSIKGKNIRPTSDRVKGSIFNILKDEVENKKVLDLFAGTGAWGMEALSRGAKEVTFVDSSFGSITTIKKNLQILGLENFRILRGDFKTILNRLSANSEKFDLIFADPPYLKGLVQKVIDKVIAGSLLSEKGILIIELHKKEELEIPEGSLILAQEKKIGDTKTLFFLKK